MDFAPHLRTIFAARGAGARYYPRLGASVPLKAIRIGGGQPVKLGPVTVYIEALAFDVLAADVPSPDAGDVILVGDTSYSVETASRPPNDGEALLWRLNCRWGAPMAFRSSLGTGATLTPATITAPIVGAAAAAGAAAVTIKTTYAIGKLIAGDKIIIGADPTPYTVTGPGVAAASNTFTSVPITPALVQPAALNAVVTIAFARDYPVRGAVAGFDASQLLGGLLVGDRRVVVMQSALTAAGCTDVPKASDKITFEGKSFTINTATAYYEGEAPKLWELQCR
jgi:hypothetical protein